MRRTQRRGDRGSATAETALALPALVVLVAAGMTAIMVGSAQLRCIDAAREAARAVARGEPAGRVREIANQAAPTGARTDIATTGDLITVTTSAEVHPISGLLPAIVVRGRVITLAEPGLAGDGGVQ
jgi:Flp pilus assembly protein TadG